MNRRSALLLTLLSGGLLPLAARAEDDPSADPDDRPKKGASKVRRASRPDDPDDLSDRPMERNAPEPAGGAAEEKPPANFPEQAGETWRSFDISKYTALPHEGSRPQDAIVEWIQRRTGTGVWTGEKIAVLSASKSQIRVYNTPQIVKQVEEVVRRFKEETSGALSIRVRFFAAADTRWRMPVHTRLTPVGSGPQGQQIWTLKSDDTAAVLAQLQGATGVRSLMDRRFKIINGQTMTVEAYDTIDYVVGPQRDSAVGLGYQPASAQVNEGVTLRLSPLLTLDGDELDAAIELRANTVKSMHKTRIVTRREIGQGEMFIDVPEVVGSRLNQTVRGWPLGQTLLISGGIQPGILQNKGGFLNLRLPGTVPSGTELLVFLDAEIPAASDRPSRRSDD